MNEGVNLNNQRIKTIGERIKAERTRKDNYVTLDTLADKTNVARQTISKWEKGEGNGPTVWELIRLCDFFGCDYGYLIGDYECRTREATDIRAQTGLSETALLNLKKNVGGYWDALNSVLENETFWQFLKLMETYKQTGAPDDMVGKYVKSSIEFAAKKLLPDPERKDTDVFTDTFFQSVCNHYCWALMEDYKKRNTDTGKEK